LIFGGIIGSATYLVSSIINAHVTKTGPWVSVLNESLGLILMVSFRVFRYKFKDNTTLHEYLVIGIFAILILLCTMTNTNILPAALSGPGIDDFRASYTGQFFVIAIFTLISLKKVVVLVGPLYLIAQYFHWKQNATY
jgi:hypothetical protein